ncbi:MAG: hypothetical protein ABSC19_20855 [Syntrophorhabdales bacterium]|jgi:hypothetical protein
MATTRLSVPLVLVLLFTALFLFCAGPLKAQDDYPYPAGNPDTWGTGRPERLAPETPGSPMSQEGYTATERPTGNQAQERPDAPAGEAQEVYTGTRQFGGIAGTGMNQSGQVQGR